MSNLQGGEHQQVWPTWSRWVRTNVDARPVWAGGLCHQAGVCYMGAAQVVVGAMAAAAGATCAE